VSARILIAMTVGHKIEAVNWHLCRHVTGNCSKAKRWPNERETVWVYKSALDSEQRVGNSELDRVSRLSC
jgi:hypothetical protein